MFPIAQRHFVAEHRANRSIRVANRQFDGDPLTAVECCLAPVDEFLIEMLFQFMILKNTPGAWLVIVELRSDEDRRQIEPIRLPMLNCTVHVEQFAMTDGIFKTAKAELCQVFTHFLREELEEVDDELRLATKPRAQCRILRRDTDRAGVKVADTHQNAAGDNERRRREAVLFCAEQRADYHVTTGLHLAVHLHDNAIAHAVQHERLLSLGEAELPRCPSVLKGIKWARPCATVVP